MTKQAEDAELELIIGNNNDDDNNIKHLSDTFPVRLHTKQLVCVGP